MPSPEWRLPGPNRFARAVADDLEDGRSVLVMLPTAGVPRGLRTAVREMLPELDVNRFRLGQLTGGRGRVVDALYQRLDLDRPEDGARVDVRTFANHAALNRRLIWVDGYGATIEQLESWAAFIEQYAAAAEVSVHRRAIFAFIGAGSDVHLMPEAPSLLSKRWWWRVVDPIDTEVLVSELASGREWRPAFVETVAEVSAYDLELAALLVEEWDGAPHGLPGLLASYPVETAAAGQDWSPEPSPSRQPPASSVAAWGAGVVNAWGERDPHVHACHAAAHRPTALRRVVWLGQVRSLMPRIEIERQALAEWVHARRNRLPPDWQGRDIRSLEVGDLAAIFSLPAFRRERRRVPLARWLHRARNSIAHLDILEDDELEYARRLLQGMVRGEPHRGDSGVRVSH